MGPLPLCEVCLQLEGLVVADFVDVMAATLLAEKLVVLALFSLAGVEEGLDHLDVALDVLVVALFEGLAAAEQSSEEVEAALAMEFAGFRHAADAAEVSPGVLTSVAFLSSRRAVALGWPLEPRRFRIRWLGS